jgi:hypothetical protein
MHYVLSFISYTDFLYLLVRDEEVTLALDNIQ